MELRMFEGELNTVCRQLTHPVVMRISAVAATFDPRHAFDDPTGGLQITTSADTHHFLTDPDWIAQVFQGALAEHEVELLVFERPGFPRTKIPLHPGLFEEMCRGPDLGEPWFQMPALVPREKVEHI